MGGKLRWMTVIGLGLACGDLASEPDGGRDSAVPDVASVDASIADAAFDATLDANADVIDGSKDSGKKPIDAPYVDFDAATSPWAVTFGVGTILGVAVDSQRNVLVGGELDVNNTQFFLEELDPYGVKKWDVTPASSTSLNQRAWSVAFDSSGDAVAAGYTGGTLDIGGGSKGPGAFIAKFDSKGAFQWEYGPFASTAFRKVRTKSNGNVVAFGYLQGTDDYGGGTVSSGSYHAAVLLELTSSGTYVGARAWTGGDQLGYALAVDPWDDVFISGTFQGTIDFGGGAMTGPQVGSNGDNLFIAEFDSSGAYVNQMQTNSSAVGDGITELATDWKGDLLISGIAYANVNLGGSNLNCKGALVGMLDTSLNHVWSKCVPLAWGMSVDALPTVGAMLAGDYWLGSDFGQGALPPDSGVFLASFGSTGSCDASVGGASPVGAWQELYGVSYLTWPDAVIAGACHDQLHFSWGTVACASNGYPEAFVARVAP